MSGHQCLCQRCLLTEGFTVTDPRLYWVCFRCPQCCKVSVAYGWIGLLLDRHKSCKQITTWYISGDDDSGTDENCDSPPLSPPSPPTSGFAMAKKMTVGVVSGECLSQKSASKGACDADDSDDKLLQSSLGLLFSSQLPTADTLTQLRQRKKVTESLCSWSCGWVIRVVYCLITDQLQFFKH